MLLLSTANLLICSKPYNRRTLSTAPFSNIHSSFDLDPYFITGFADGESCFSFQFFKNNRLTVGWEVRPSFSVHLHKKDLTLLKQIQSFFAGVGSISVSKKETALYSVKSLKDLTNIIIPHFLQYPLITQKQADFLLFKSVIEIMNKKEHLTIEGLNKIVSIKASINNGLSEILTKSFPNIAPVERPFVKSPGNFDPN